MIEWLDEFYGDPEFRSEVQSTFLPLFSAYAASVVDSPSKAFVASLAASFVSRYLDSSRAQLQEVLKDAADPMIALTGRFDEWAEKRPGKVAANETVRSANAVRMQDMKDRGVTKKVWVASGGKTCPFCAALDGTVLGVEEKFFESSDTFLPEGVTEPLRFNNDHMHPPIHNGCDCSIAESTE